MEQINNKQTNTFPVKFLVCDHINSINNKHYSNRANKHCTLLTLFRSSAKLFILIICFIYKKHKIELRTLFEK